MPSCASSRSPRSGPTRYQPREHFDEESLVSLAASIQAVGVLQPVLVRQTGAQEYELIAGERRWRAARRAGLQTIPAIVRPTEDVRSLEQALVENLHREDLTPLEEAAAYQQLIEEFGHTQEEVAQRVGKSRSAVANTLRLLHLPPSIQRLLAEGQITAGHARALLGSPDRVFQEQLARAIVAEHLTVREVEDRVREHAGEADEVQEAGDEKASAEPVAAVRPAALLELEELLSESSRHPCAGVDGGPPWSRRRGLRHPRGSRAHLPGHRRGSRSHRLSGPEHCTETGAGAFSPACAQTCGQPLVAVQQRSPARNPQRPWWEARRGVRGRVSNARRTRRGHLRRVGGVAS